MAQQKKRTCRGATADPNVLRLLLLIFFFCLFCFVPSAGAASTSGPPGNPADWVMTFHDEFDGSSLDLTKWQTSYVWGRTNNDELEWYVDDAAIVSNGTLKLIAKHETRQTGFPYTSGLISGHKAFSQMYGYFEIRMKIPSGKGFWPAFWLLPIPADLWPPEIDVMENLSHDPHTIYMTHHYTTNYPDVGGDRGGQHGGAYTGPDYSADFHTYGVEWNSKTIVWYLDGVERYRSTEHVPIAGHGFTGMYLIANLAVGGSWPGAPDGSTIFPNQLEIDYIRVYAKAGSTPAAPASLRQR